MREDAPGVFLNLLFRYDKANAGICNQLELRFRHPLLQGQKITCWQVDAFFRDLPPTVAVASVAMLRNSMIAKLSN